MKNTLSLGLLLAISFSLQAQVEVTTRSFELESQNKHKEWKIIDAGRDASNEIYIKFAKPICDMSKDTWTGTKTYRGFKWDIDKLYFNDAFEYKKTESKNYSSSEEATLSNENVFGKVFMPLSTKGVGGSVISGVAMPPRHISNKFLFTNIVVPAVAVSGFKIKTSYISCGPIAASCNEYVTISELNSENAKESKGQQWIPTYNNPIPNGGNILFGTAGVNPDETKTHYVFRQYDENGAVKLDKGFSFDYQCLISAKEIETAPGIFDYIFVANTINYKKSKGALAPANQYEYLRVDGKTFEVKERIKFTGVYTKWILDNVIEKDGALYLMGACSNSATEYMGFYVLPKEKEGFQVAKINNGKLEYIKAVTVKEAETALKIPEGLKGKADVTFQFAPAKVQVVNGKISFAPQIFKDGKYGAMVNMIFGTNGDLETYLVKPEKDYARGTTFFSKDGKTMYWILDDFGVYNTINQDYTLTPKKARFVVSSIGIVKYDMDTKITAAFQNLENDDWGVLFSNPVLFENDKEIVLNGLKLTKKAKDGEVVFVTIKK